MPDGERDGDLGLSSLLATEVSSVRSGELTAGRGVALGVGGGVEGGERDANSCSLFTPNMMGAKRPSVSSNLGFID